MAITDELSLLSKAVYGGDYEASIPSGWVQIDIKDYGQYFEDRDTGFQGALYGYDSNGDGSYDKVAIAIRGTEITSINDLYNDLEILDGTNDSDNDGIPDFKQERSLVDFYNEIEKTLTSLGLNSVKQYITGQSLGGTLAQLLAAEYATGVETVTFEAFGAKRFLTSNSASTSNITNYVVSNDLFATYYLDGFIGKVTYLYPVPMDNSALGALLPHNYIPFSNDLSISDLIIPEGLADWSKEKALALWFYDKNLNLTSEDLVRINRIYDKPSLSVLASAVETIENLSLHPVTLTYNTGNGYYIIGDMTGGSTDTLTGSDAILGIGGNDTIYGNAGDDIINGGSGDDLIYGDSKNQSNDTISGISYNDSIDGGLGNDTVYGGKGSDTIYGGLGSDSIMGGDGDDYLYGNSTIVSSGDGNNSLYGGIGDDYLVAGDGADILDGGTDNDILIAGQGSDMLYGGDGDDELYGSSGSSFLVGGSGNDTYHINTLGHETIFDSDGNGSVLVDGILISGGKQIDGTTNQYTDGMYTYTLASNGNLTISSPSGSFVINMFNNGDLGINLEGYVPPINSGHIDNYIYGQYETMTAYDYYGHPYITDVYDANGQPVPIEPITGTGLNDQITGHNSSYYHDQIFGGNGDDVIRDGDNTTAYGQNGNDQMNLGNNSTAYGGDGYDNIRVGNNSTVYLGNSASDANITSGTRMLKMSALASTSSPQYDCASVGTNSTVYGTNGADSISASANDLINAGNGNNYINANNSTINAGNGNDTIVGDWNWSNNGYDNINAGDGNNRINNVANSFITTGSGNDIIGYDINNPDFNWGGYGGDNNTIYSGAGNDYVNPGSNSYVYAGEGNDYINLFRTSNDYIDLGNGNNTISSFQIGQNFTISSGAGNDSISVGDYSIITTGDGNKHISAGSNSAITAGNGINAISAGAGSTIISGTGNDSISANGWSENPTLNYINAGDGNNIISSNANSSTILAGSGNDFIIANQWGQSGYNNIDAGEGNNTISSGYSSTINVGSGDDSISTGAYSVIHAGEGNNYISSNNQTGDSPSYSTIIAGSGNDTVTGYNLNNSVINVGEGNNNVSAGANSTIISGGGNDFINANNYSPNGNGYEYINAGDGNNNISAGGNSTIISGSGNDFINANNYSPWNSSGYDYINAGDGNNAVSVGDNSTITTGSGNDSISAGTHSYISAGEGNNIVGHYNNLSDINDWTDGSDYNTITVGSGDDTISAGNYNLVKAGEGDNYVELASYDTVYSGKGNDTINLQYASFDDNNLIYAGDGNNIVSVGSNSTIYAGSGDDYISVNGWSQDNYTNYIDAGAGNNTISAGDNTIINVGSGNDYILGIGNNSLINLNRGNVTIADGRNRTINLGAGITKDSLEYSLINGNLVAENNGSSEVAIGNLFTNPPWDGDNQQVIAFSDGSSLTMSDIKAMNLRSQMIGTSGNDTLTFTYESDTYVFNRGDGQDGINNFGSNNNLDTIQFGAGIKKDDITISKSNGNLILKIKDTNDQLTIDNWASSANYITGQFVFEDGSVITKAEIGAVYNVVQGTDRDDWIMGTPDNDSIIGGKGNDELMGSGGGDIYVFNIGDGQDILEGFGTSSKPDIIKFGSGITKDKVNIAETNGNLVIKIKDSTDQITINGGVNNLQNMSAQIQFYDGSIITKDDIIAMNLPSLFQGTTGNDNFNFTNQNDTYVFNKGDGQDTINNFGSNNQIDTIQFGEGITQNNLVVSKSRGSLIVKIKDTNDQLAFNNWNSNITGQFVFTDGTVLNTSVFNSIPSIIQGSDWDDWLWGTPDNDIFIGGKGNDEIDNYGFQRGNDTYVFNIGDGQDTIDGFGYNNQFDTIKFGTGITRNSLIFSELNNSLIIGIKNSTDQITLNDWVNNLQHISGQIQFDDGSIMTINDIISIFSPNHPPTDTLISGTLNEDSSVILDVLASASDPDGDILSISNYTQGANGTITLNAQNQLVYTPNTHFSGSDAFNYTISDGKGGTVTETVNLTINHVNHAPTDTLISGTLNEDSSVVLDVLANASDPDGDTLSINTFTQGTHGSITKNSDNKLVYTPNTLYSGNDAFTYTISDGNGGTVTETVNLTINHVNHTPTETLTSGTLNEDSSVILDVLANANDVDGDTLSISNFTQTTHGSITQTQDNKLLYTPNSLYYGTDSFAYTISDGNGGTVTQTVNLTINHVNHAPTETLTTGTLNEDSSVTLDVLANASDIDGDKLSISNYTQGGNGTITLNTKNQLVYTPKTHYSGSDAFNYTISDGNGGTVTKTVALTVTPLPINITGTDGNDVLTGNYKDNILDGGKGADTMAGGTGNDTYYVDNVGDVVIENANEGMDSVYSSVNYNLSANVENLTLTGTSAINGTGNSLNNNITGNTANNTLTGQSGNDTLTGGKGNDYLNGGSGNNDYIFNLGDGNDTIVDSGSSKITFGSGITKNNVKLTANGTDVVVSFTNSSDTILLTNQVTNSNIASISFADGTSLTSSDISSALNVGSGTKVPPGGGQVTVGSGTVYAPSGNNNITSNSGNNIIYSGSGNDTISDMNGNNYINAGNGNNNITAGYGTDTVVAGSGNDVITDMYGNNSINAGDGNNVITTGYNNDTVTAGAGDDVIVDMYGNNYINAGDGNNSISTGYNNDTVFSGSGNDTINDSYGNNYFSSGAGNDIINAGFNNDTIIGGAGNDTLNGGDGDDVYKFSAGDGKDLVTDSSGNDSIVFDSGVSKNNIAFYKDASGNLTIDYGKNAGQDVITVSKYTTNPIEKVQLGDGTYITNTQINSLIQNMTAYATSNHIEFTGISSEKNNQALMNLVASSFHS